MPREVKPGDRGSGMAFGQRVATLTLQAQTVFYALTGLWPLVHMPSFLSVTGPKTDLWLVGLVAALISVVAATLTYSMMRGRIDPAVVLLAVGSACVLLLTDVICVAQGIISTIYLVDAAIEALILVGWAIALRPSAPR